MATEETSTGPKRRQGHHIDLVMMNATQHKGLVSVANFSRHGDRFITASNDHTAMVWSSSPPYDMQFVLQGHTASVKGCAFSPDDRHCATASFDCSVRLWDAADGRFIHTLGTLPDWALGCTFSPVDANFVASSGRETKIVAWDTRSYEQVLSINTEHSQMLWDCKVSPNGQDVVVASFDNLLSLWDIRKPSERKATLSKHTNQVWRCQYSDNGQLLISGASDNSAIIWDMSSDSYRPITTFKDHAQPVNGVSIDRSLGLAASGSFDGTVKVWNIYTGELDHEFQHKKHNPQARVTDCVFSPSESGVILAVDSASQVFLWSLRRAWSPQAHTNFPGELQSAVFTMFMIRAFGSETPMFWFPIELMLLIIEVMAAV